MRASAFSAAVPRGGWIRAALLIGMPFAFAGAIGGAPALQAEGAQDANAVAPPLEQTPPAAVTLPASDAKDALANLRDDTPPSPLVAPPWPTWGTPGWNASGPWDRWAELVLEEAAAPRPDPGRRAALALAALEQRRYLDAWAHVAACADEPGVMAAILPRLAPGVPSDVPLGADATGGRAGALPDGVLLRPALPPLDAESPYERPRIRKYVVRDVVLGAATCDFELAVEADGVEIALTHTGGGPARVRLVMPVPHDREVRSLYVDWERLDAIPEVIEMELRAADGGGEREVAAWARFVPRRPTWPAPEELIAPAQMRRAGLALVRDADDPLTPLLDQLARVAPLLVGVPVTAGPASISPAGGASGSAPLGIPFFLNDSEGARQAKLAFVLSALERFRLR